MKLRDYLSSKAVTLCFLAIGALLLAIFMAVAGTGWALVWTAEGCLLLLIAGWLCVGWYIESRRLDKLERIQKELKDKYLLGEVLPPPRNLLEKQYARMMKTVSRSAIGIAEQAMREKEEYCAYVESWIHEIKTPLTACSLILDNGGDTGKLRRELMRADNLTESILYYARLRSAQKDRLIHAVDLAALMDETVKSQMSLLIAAHIGVELRGGGLVQSDGKALGFILKQLLINCAKYCPGCRVTMTASDAAIVVEDDGIGIPSQDLPRITERGFTGSNGRRLGGSTGMGLYLVNELCGQLGVVLTAESAQGSYTRLTLTFGSLTEA